MRFASTQPTWQAMGCMLLFVAPAIARADGIVVTKVYDPYVQSLETELELRSVWQSDEESPDLQRHSLGIGRSLSDRWGAELYAVWTRDRGDTLHLDIYELEFKTQVTEQGEYGFDWGALFEVERDVNDDIWEMSATLLTARDFGRWTAVANLGVGYEWGSGVDNEVETEFHAQARFRLMELLEPAIELHLGQDTAALGPAFAGTYRPSAGKKLQWDVGVFFAFDENSPDRIIKLNLEYEF